MNRAVVIAMHVALSATACQGCHGDHPYVPYSIADDASRVALSPDAQALVIDAAAPTTFAQQAGEAAPADAKTWTLGGLSLTAPEGTVFQAGLSHDLDGDGALDAITLVRAKGALASPHAHTQVVYFAGEAAGGAKAGVVVGETPDLAADPTCSPVQRIALVGRHSVFVEVGVECVSHGDVLAMPAKGGTKPTRWAAVVGVAGAGAAGVQHAGRAPSVRLSWLVTNPRGAPTLALDVDGSDYDGDGLDDVALHVTLDGGTPPFEAGPRVAALLRWIDRPAGMSREPDQPEASFQILAGAAASHAGKAKDAVAVPIMVHRTKALYDALCAEGGLPRLTRAAEGRAMDCGPSSRALEEAGIAETHALVTTGDVLGAIAALDRAEEAPATHTPARVTEAQAWIAQAAPVALASSLRAITAVPLLDHGRAPAWGALGFEPGGKLLVRTLGPVIRVDPVQGDEVEATDVPAWKAPVTSPDGSLRWASTADPCDGSELRATFAGGAEGEARVVLVALPLGGRPGARCNRGSGEAPLGVPLSWGPDGLFALVGGEPIAFSIDLSHATLAPGRAAGTVPAFGAPRSPDGKTLAVPTSQGIVVRGARTRLYRAKELDGAYAELRDCAVSDDATRVACTRGGRAFVGVW